MGIRDILERMKEKKLKYKQYEEQMKVMEKYEERKKSSNERELERFKHEAREDSIKKELEEWRNHRNKDIEYGHQILKTKNMFDPKANGNEILNNQNLFVGGKKLFAGKSMFMK